MRLVGGLFEDKQDLNLALEDLQNQGFVAFNVFGPAELFRSPATREEIVDELQSQRHTGAGVVEGITVQRYPVATEDPSAQPVKEDLLALDVPEEAADAFVAGLRQDQLLLLVQTKAGRAEKAEGTMQDNNALLVRIVRPEDAIHPS